MQQNIWSSPQVGGSGGALKALARNVANHLKLNRSSLKRVVAQVVAEHHTLGEVADYKGHMYFAKPDRLNFQELIAQSKEAFDDLLLHEPRAAAKRRAALRQRSRNPASSKVNLQMKVSPPQLSRGAKKASVPPKSEPPAKPSLPRNQRRRKSSTTIFQLADAGRRSLNGVIIDDTHLPHDGEQREILLHVPSTLARRSRKRLRSAAEKNPEKDQAQKNLKPKKNPAQAEPKPSVNQDKKNQEVQTMQPAKKRLPQKNRRKELKPKPPQEEKPPEKSSQNTTRSVLPAKKKPAAPKVSPTARSRRSQRRIKAKGQTFHKRMKAGDSQSSPRRPAAGKNPVQRTNTRLQVRPLKKRLPLLRRTYEKPWLVRRSKRRRLSGGSQVARQRPNKSPVRPKKLDNTDVEWAEQSEPTARSNKAEAKKSSPKLRSKRSSHVGRQMRNVNFPWYTPYQFQGAAGATQTPNKGASIPPFQLLREKNRQLNQRLAVSQPIPQSRRAPNITSRQRHHRRMQERLMRDLLREEAIDEPLSNGSGVFRRSRGGWQAPRSRETMQQTSKSPMAKTPIKSEPEQQDHRSVERVSSRIKRLANDRRCRQPIATSERIMIPPPKTINDATQNRARSSTRMRRRYRSVPVDSSLGSIALMGQPQQSKQALTPAKRHLTIAFMNKRSERSSPAVQHWK
ncbi:serine/arginine repetitive matrix protein 1 [Drosophila biarmipes]|uniref:serine/arginine repetitive matrix protein 1 n=1 Tax=Drosophila biarmipes TaxID=125945 RepID=UPI0007E7E277|nr:serine/arginine repetitive matrix protein 1 [Drosophila biarmipes]